MSKTSSEWRQLRDAICQGEFSAAAALLHTHPHLLDERNGIGETVLHFLAVEDHLPGVAWLHAQGASVKTSNEFGTPILFEVALLGYRDLFLWLVQHGADLKQLNQSGDSLQDYLAEYQCVKMLKFINEHFPANG
jgi:ankyrin repeat protein